MTDKSFILSGWENCGPHPKCDDCMYNSFDNCVKLLENDIRELLKEQPEQKHGHWILDPNGMDWNLPAWVCSECHGRNNNLPLMDGVNEHNVYRWAGSQYCPCCGAKMDEKVKHDLCKGHKCPRQTEPPEAKQE